MNRWWIIDDARNINRMSHCVLTVVVLFVSTIHDFLAIHEPVQGNVLVVEGRGLGVGSYARGCGGIEL